MRLFPLNQYAAVPSAALADLEVGGIVPALCRLNLSSVRLNMKALIRQNKPLALKLLHKRMKDAVMDISRVHLPVGKILTK